MSFDNIWNQLLRKQPRLADPNTKVELTAGNLKVLLRQIYEKGADSAAPKGTIEEMFRAVCGVTSVPPL